jgi:glucokinase
VIGTSASTARAQKTATLRRVSFDEPSLAPARGEPNLQTVLGIDVGGTKISLATMRAGALATPQLLATEKASQRALIDQLLGAVRSVRQRSSIAAVGIGIPSVVEFDSGRVRSSVNVPLQDVPLRKVLSEQLDGLPVYVDNDATCAALAEAHDEDGVLRERNLVMFTVGTGVGGGIIIAGRIYRGASGAAGELGHTIIGLDLADGADPQNGFPRRGSLESLASGRALDELAKQLARSPDSTLGQAAAAESSITGAQLVEAARGGENSALAALELLARRLGVGIANAINTFDPDVVAIGGGVSAAGELLLDPAIATAQQFVLPGVGTRTQIRLARSGPSAGVRGAALLALSELANEPA